MIPDELREAIDSESVRLGLTAEQHLQLARWALHVELAHFAIERLMDGAASIASLKEDGEPVWSFDLESNRGND